MKIIVGLFGAGFAVLTTAVLLYVSMTTGLGPWMAPTIVLVGGVLMRLVSRADRAGWRTDIILMQAVGSTGGAVATAVGFSLPTLFFLAPDVFAAWLAEPVTFAASIAGLTFAAGGWGMWIARRQAPALLADTGLRFPVSAAIFDTIVSQTRKAAARLLGLGVTFAGSVGLMRDGFGRMAPFLPRTFYLMPSWCGRVLPVEMMPVSWAIGFLAGFPIVMPLAVGMISKYAVVWPLNAHSHFLPFSLFSPLDRLDFTFAFCSGIVLSQTIGSFLAVPRACWQYAQRMWNGFTQSGLVASVRALAESPKESNVHEHAAYRLWARYEWVIALSASVALFSYFSFPFLAQVTVLGLSFALLQHLNAFACRTGLGTYGRYMTFIMVPAMLLAPLSSMQITILCVFVGIAGAAGIDMLFSYRVAEMADMPVARVHRAQLFGVVITALCMGILFWVLCSHFSLGSAPLVAHRAQARALLLHSFHFHWLVLGLGALYGMVLKRLRVNPILAFGGLIMPNQITIGLALGAALRAASKDPESYTPFWSGVFAGDALWVLSQLR